MQLGLNQNQTDGRMVRVFGKMVLPSSSPVRACSRFSLLCQSLSDLVLQVDLRRSYTTPRFGYFIHIFCIQRERSSTLWGSDFEREREEKMGGLSRPT